MKNLYIWNALFASLLIFSSCEKELDLVPLDKPTTANFYSSPQSAEAAITASYAALQGDLYGIEAILTPTTVTTDDGIPFLTGNADRVALWRYNITPANNWTSSPWGLSYIAIQRCNVAISRIPNIDMDVNKRARLVAEAKFLRAMMYFNLVRFYGGVPLVTTETITSNPESVNVPRSTADEVYNLIESDLKEAESVLPVSNSGNDRGRATKGAAKGLLAKIFLTRAGSNASSQYWTMAASKAKEVIDLGVYDLWANYRDVYEINNRGGKESVFEVMYRTDLTGNFHSSYWTPRGDPRVPFNGFGTIRPTKNLFDQFDSNDKRKAVTFLTSFVHPTTGATVNLTIDNANPALAISFDKLTDLSSKVYGGGGKSFPYMRFSEILLIYAEALNESNSAPTFEAYTAINRVRNRAGMPDLVDLNKQTFKTAVLNERRLELAFEGHRWFDLVRTGQLLTAVNGETSFNRAPQIKATNVLFPIPLRELGVPNSPLTQNPGY